MLIDDEIAIDAGSIGFTSPFSVQKRIKHVFLSHSHIDHVCSLPLFLDNVYEPSPACPTVYGSQSVLDSLQADLFNDRVWPDLLRLSREETPFFATQRLEHLSTVSIDGIHITPVSLDHTVPVFGFIIENESSAVGIVCDTSPTEMIWQELNRRSKLKCVFLEASFPNSMDWLAKKAMHLTPALFQQELTKLDNPVRTIVIHVKPAFNDRIRAEIEVLGMQHPSRAVCVGTHFRQLGTRLNQLCGLLGEGTGPAYRFKLVINWTRPHFFSGFFRDPICQRIKARPTKTLEFLRREWYPRVWLRISHQNSIRSPLPSNGSGRN